MLVWLEGEGFGNVAVIKWRSYKLERTQAVGIAIHDTS